MIAIKNDIDFINFEEQNLNPKLKDKINKALDFILHLEEIQNPVELSIQFVNDQTIQELNKNYRNIDKSTDVLSFPIFNNISEIKKLESSKPILLGDVILNKNKAEEQAKEIGQSIEDELLYLTIHSILHLLGYDHQNEDDLKEMRKMEKFIFQSKDNFE